MISCLSPSQMISFGCYISNGCNMTSTAADMKRTYGAIHVIVSTAKKKLPHDFLYRGKVSSKYARQADHLIHLFFTYTQARDCDE